MLMATCGHSPRQLLEVVDRVAKALRMSRNRLILRALEREVTPGSGWSPGFFERLSAVDPETRAAVDELLVSVRQARRSRRDKALEEP